MRDARATANERHLFRHLSDFRDTESESAVSAGVSLLHPPLHVLPLSSEAGQLDQIVFRIPYLHIGERRHHLSFCDETLQMGT